jgi:S-adenosylmethionine hydrolase
MGILTLLTDFGTRDYFVAAVKGTVLRLAPGTQVVDVSHEVPPGSLEEGAYLLAATAPWFPDGTVHLAVVDPGVGSVRRILVAHGTAAASASQAPVSVTSPASSTSSSPAPSSPPSPSSQPSASRSAWVVAPDNGLVSSLIVQTALAAPGEAPWRWRFWSVERQEIFLPGPGQTFHGRDRFAPVAAHLLRGGPVDELGLEIADPVRLAAETPLRAPGELSGRVVHIDRFGNLVTDIPSAWLPAGPCQVQVAAHRTTRVAGHYAEIPPGEPALLAGSLGTLELAMRGEDLASRWRIRPGTQVRVRWQG